ncbi:hypothetical protein FSP39_019515 [Pinctada imbricata]|uniref:Transmembrane protein 164 n=1 Tax=Pinctada imbricata TaxID=66713 RepID=A0AA88Y163_PINIB|nr:hypothetical protein FSP39_019515 [Pinctada imbricata]
MEADVSQSGVNQSEAQRTGWFDWAYVGVDFGLAGNGGVDCRDFISLRQRVIESALASACAGLILYRALFHLRMPDNLDKGRTERCGKRILLVVHCLIFGIELGFKFATKQMIYILNPCHLATMMQIYCLAAPPNKVTTAVFRLHLHMLTGAPIAILFPVINTRLLPFEIEVYYIQHVLMLVIPFYLLRIGGVYTTEPLLDFSWAQVSLGLLYVYHFIPLQYLAYQSKVNLNNMLCPAVSDPFYGPGYRVCAMTHQGLCIMILGKFYTWFSMKIGMRLHPSDNHIEKHLFKKDMYGIAFLNSTEDDTCEDKSVRNNKIHNGKNGIITSSNSTNGHAKSS